MHVVILNKTTRTIYSVNYAYSLNPVELVIAISSPCLSGLYCSTWGYLSCNCHSTSEANWKICVNKTKNRIKRIFCGRHSMYFRVIITKLVVGAYHWNVKYHHHFRVLILCVSIIYALDGTIMYYSHSSSGTQVGWDFVKHIIQLLQLYEELYTPTSFVWYGGRILLTYPLISFTGEI